MIYEELPLFEGIKPSGTAAKLSGAIDRRTRPYHIGDEVVLVVECVVTGVDHSETKGGVARVHKLGIRDAYELGGDRAPDLVATLSEEYAAALEEAGILDPSLPFEEQTGDLVEYDADEHGDPEPGDVFLVGGVASRWDVVADAGSVPLGEVAGELDDDGRLVADGYGWVDLDAYSDGFGPEEAEALAAEDAADAEATGDDDEFEVEPRTVSDSPQA